jgi:hypothetical protein
MPLQLLAAEFSRAAVKECSGGFANMPGSRFKNFAAYLQDLLQRARVHLSAESASQLDKFQLHAKVYDSLRTPLRAQLLVRSAPAPFATP